MKFGKVDHPEKIDFSLPEDHFDTEVLLKNNKNQKLSVYVGCAKWNKNDLKGFYPPGTKDELIYYASQFNSIELNATFYRIFSPDQVEKWRLKTPDDFKFFPKVTKLISQIKRLKNTERIVGEYIHSIAQFEDKLGMCFLQTPQTFAPKSFEDVESFLNYWPKEFPLAMEFRHPDWFSDEVVNEELTDLLKAHNTSHIITDVAGRRDMIHCRLTSPSVFIRFTGANHSSDCTRLDDWVERLSNWAAFGLENIYFFVHQNLELESPLLSAYFIEQLNEKLNLSLKIPKTLHNKGLFDE